MYDKILIFCTNFSLTLILYLYKLIALLLWVYSTVLNVEQLLPARLRGNTQIGRLLPTAFSVRSSSADRKSPLAHSAVCRSTLLWSRAGPGPTTRAPPSPPGTQRNQLQPAAALAIAINHHTYNWCQFVHITCP